MSLIAHTKFGSTGEIERHLQENNLSGSVPRTLGTINTLRELFLYNNSLSGPVPDNLLNKQGLTYRFLPGNLFAPPPPH
nr:putative receptor-like protein kinase At3g47110 [Setaria viridis]